ncbi:MAG: hypothetical protein ACNA7Y_03855 [Gammaproteobacteria bacterium]
MSFWGYVGTLIAACIGAMFSPFFSQHLHARKIKQDERLKNLEETYLLTKKIDEYSTSIMMTAFTYIDENHRNSDFKSAPKIIDSPLTRVVFLLEYHLKAPKDLILEIESFGLELLFPIRTICEAISNQKEKTKLHQKAAEQCATSTEKVKPLSNKILEWIKNEKSEIDLSINQPFLKKIWLAIKLEIERYKN